MTPRFQQPKAPTRPRAQSRILAIGRAGYDANDFVLFATGLARQYDMALDFIDCCEEPPGSLGDCYALGTSAIVQVLDRRDEAIDLACAPMRAMLNVASESGPPTRWSAISDLLDEDEVFRRARDAAFVMLSMSRPFHADMAFAEHVLVRTKSPILVVPAPPPAKPAFDTIVCAWDGSPQARRALRASLPFGCNARAVKIVAVGEAAKAATASPSLDDVAAELSASGIEAETTYLTNGSGGIATELFHYCKQSHADLLVMGAFHHWRLREHIFGGLTRDALREAPLPVFMSH